MRILECERSLGGPATPVEFWDAGGSTDYENCWPAIMQDALGVVIVAPPARMPEGRSRRRRGRAVRGVAARVAAPPRVVCEWGRHRGLLRTPHPQVYNPDNEGHVSESGAWYDYFVKNNELPDEQCIVFAFNPTAQRGARQRTSPKLQHLNVVNVSLEDGPFLLQQFERFLKVIKAKKDALAKEAEYHK